MDEERRSVAAIAPVEELEAACTWDALYILYAGRKFQKIDLISN